MRRRLGSFVPGVADRSSMERCIDDLERTVETLQASCAEQIRQRQRCEALTRALHAEQQRARRLFELMPVACLRADARGRIVDVNPAGTSLLEADREALVGGSVSGLFIEADRACVVALLGTAAGDRPRSAEVSLRARSSAEPIPCALQVSGSHGPDGERTFSCVLDDLRPRRRAEELALLNRRKSSLFAMVGHELRNPLAAIHMGLDVIGHRLRDIEGLQRPLTIVRRQVRNMSCIVDDMLDVERAVDDELRLERSSVDVGLVVDQACAATEATIESRGQVLSIDVPIDGLAIDADEARAVQVLVNLLQNASKYTPDGGRLGLVVRRDEPRWCSFRVWDEGIGMSDEDIRRLSGLFVQGRRVSDRPPSGMGIGLYLVDRIVERHGGRLEIHSKDQGRPVGSEVVVRLPVAQRSAVDTESLPLPKTANRRRVLVVDADADLASMLAELLSGDGHEVRVAHDAVEAMGTLDGFAPDRLLVDIGLPDLTGRELASRLRQHAGVGAKIVGMSASEQDSTVASAFDAVLLKPIRSTDLVAILDGDEATR